MGAGRGAKWSAEWTARRARSTTGSPQGSLIFSADGKRVAYAAQKSREERVMVVVDGQAGAEYDGIEKGSPIFSPDGVLEYLAIKEGSLYRIKYTPTP